MINRTTEDAIEWVKDQMGPIWAFMETSGYIMKAVDDDTIHLIRPDGTIAMIADRNNGGNFKRP